MQNKRQFYFILGCNSKIDKAKVRVQIPQKY